MLAMALGDTHSGPNTDNISENNGATYGEQLRPRNELIYSNGDPMFQQEQDRRERTLDWVLDEHFQQEETSENSIFNIGRNVSPEENILSATEYQDMANIKMTDSTDTVRNRPETEYDFSNVEASSGSSITPYVKHITTMKKYFPPEEDSPSNMEFQEQTSVGAEINEVNHLINENIGLGFENDFSDVESSNVSSVCPFVKPIIITKRYFAPKECTSNNTKLSEITPGESETNAVSHVKITEDNKHKNDQSKNAETCAQNKITKNLFRNSTSEYIEQVMNKQKKKRTICKYCTTSVTNFERHLYRHHLEEKAVQDYLKFPKNTKDGRQMRRNILALLRYEVDFKNYVAKEEYDSEKLPCAHCKRIIKVKYLRRHYKKCIVKPINESGKSVHHQSASQTLVACASEHSNITATLRVKNEVFCRMAADEIGYLARRDALIRHFGEYYLKKHKRAQISIACSNKMRECARLLIEMRRRIGKPLFSFIQILDPILFDDVVISAKAISGYDEERKNYKAPSLALHLGTTLQQICELTTHLLLKKSIEFKCDNFEERLKEIKRFRFLVQTQWSNEVSSLALKDLAEKKWNKPVMLPLTEDITTFRNHILKTANKNVALLKEDNSNTNAFRKLVDASLAFTILFNRRRIGDVQYAEIDSYKGNFTSSNQTEILEQLTESEKTLTSSYKRVIAGGKGSRAIVILFPPIVQENINLLLEIRGKTDIVPQKNRYLFAYPGVTDQWVRGDVVLKNFAKSCKIQNPEAMTSNRLRKQIATLMQIMNLDKNDYSQFAKFMGHTEKTHKEFYEITQDAYQTAKVAKLLSLFDQGKGAEYRNKELSNVDIDPNKESPESESEDEGKALGMTSQILNSNSGKGNDSSSYEPIKKKSEGRVRWTTQQKKLVTLYFKNHIKNRKAPKKFECEKFISKNQNLMHNLNWVRVKTFVYNTYTSKKK